MEQLVARRAHNPKVGGSSPPPATKPKWLHPVYKISYRGVEQFGSSLGS